MALTTQPLLEITDGVSSVKFMDSAATTPALIAAMNYRLSYGGWSPKVAKRNQNPFDLPYTKVLEELTIDIRGSTPDVCYSKLQTLMSMLDQGERWFNNEIVAPVFVRYQPLGSGKTTYMQDVVIGGGTDDNNAQLVTLPDEFNVTGFISYLKGVRVRFWRRIGSWLCETETPTAVTGANQLGPIAVSYSVAAPTLSPVDLLFWLNSNSSSFEMSGFIVSTHDDRYIGVYNGVTGLSGTSSQADAGTLATGGNVGRSTASVAGVIPVISPILTPIEETEYVAIYATVRNNSTTIDAYIQVSLGGNLYPAAQAVKIAAAATPKPQAVFLGILPTRGRRASKVNIKCTTLSSTATVDFDTVWLIGVNRATNIIATILPQASMTLSTTGIRVLSRLLLETVGEVCQGVPAVNEAVLSYSGSAFGQTGGALANAETALALIFTDDTLWKIANAARNAASTVSFQPTRYKAYLTPE